MTPSAVPTPLPVVEQAIRDAVRRHVFAPNDTHTWTLVTGEVSDLLARLWRPTPPWGYSVQCGLGSTMTPQDILDGYMIVQVVLQMIRPAEFVELLIKERMGGSLGTEPGRA